MLESLEALSGLFIVFTIIAIPLASVLIWFGIKIVGIYNISFWSVIAAGLATSILTQMLSLLFYALPHVKTCLGFIIGLLLSTLAIKSIFRSAIGETVIPSVLNAIAQVLAVIIGAYMFVGSLKDFIKII